MQFAINASYSVMLGWLSRASIGLSTMVDEHFGINVVEYMVRELTLSRSSDFTRRPLGCWSYSRDACLWRASE